MVDEAVRLQLFTVRQFIEKHTWCRLGGIRNQIFHAADNGLAEIGAIVRIGRKVLINEGRYFEWVERQQGARP